jgi:hypothetical protein
MTLVVGHQRVACFTPAGEETIIGFLRRQRGTPCILANMDEIKEYEA